MDTRIKELVAFYKKYDPSKVSSAKKEASWSTPDKLDASLFKKYKVTLTTFFKAERKNQHLHIQSLLGSESKHEHKHTGSIFTFSPSAASSPVAATTPPTAAPFTAPSVAPAFGLSKEPSSSAAPGSQSTGYESIWGSNKHSGSIFTFSPSAASSPVAATTPPTAAPFTAPSVAPAFGLSKEPSSSAAPGSKSSWTATGHLKLQLPDKARYSSHHRQPLDLEA
jgi:hypothetical protein